MYFLRFYILFFFVISFKGLANMANPIEEGTLGKPPFTSAHINIEAEHIMLVPNSDFSEAKFIVEYYIDADEQCAKVPLIFYASDFEKDFKVWIDGKVITTQPLPDFLHSTLNKNYKYLTAYFSHRDIQATFIHDVSSEELTTIEPDLKYFETAITKGKHVIRVIYTATHWIDHSNTLREFSFRYALSPAYQWKSYGKLHITFDAKNLSEKYKNIYTNLRTPDKGDLNSTAHWYYTEIPIDVMMFQSEEYQPFYIRALVYMNPWIFMLLFSSLLMYWHAWKINANRKINFHKTISKIALYGSLLLPLLVLLGAMCYSLFISKITNSSAGYFFIILILYPLVVPFYLFIIWLYDWGLQIKNSKSNPSLYNQ